jgi:ribosomal protein S18 acetylase RimI-like enzyme
VRVTIEPSSEITIRTARREDVPAVVRLLADDPLGARREAPGETLPEAYGEAFAAMARQGGNALIVAEREGRIIGCLQLVIIPGLTRRGMMRAEVEGVRVAADERGRAIGERLMGEAVARARAAGCGLVQLTTDKTRIEAHRFYERLGFVASHIGMKLLL